MRRLIVTVAAVLLLGGCVLQVSSDPFSNPTSQHHTQVEPDTFSFGSTIVSAFQSGRFFNGGASDIGWSTSTDGGQTWNTGSLPGITKYQGGGPYDRASDPSVAYDARHSTWLISSLGLRETTGAPAAPAVLVSRSTDGGSTWGTGPVTVATGTSLDKNWTVCDNTPSSPHYGNCYTEFDVTNTGDVVHMATSGDGGRTWAQATVALARGLGGQPVVQPGGRVVVPYLSTTGTMAALTSNDGGATYGSPVTIATLTDHPVAGGLRTEPLPSAEVDGAGRVYVVWQDCRFRIGCAENDIVMSTSANGTAWTAVTRVPIDAATSSVDHFIPGLAVDRSTSGNAARLSLAYYSYPEASCTASSCQLEVGFISSTNGGASWSASQRLAGPMSLSWLAATNQGVMVGDYISTSLAGGKAFPLFALAKAPSNGVFDESIHTVSGGLTVSGGSQATTADPVIAAPRVAARRSSSLTSR